MPIDIQKATQEIGRAGNMAAICAIRRGERTNADRATEAEAVVTLFCAMTGLDRDADKDGPDIVLGDLLAHLMHWADYFNVDFADRLQSAMDYHADEKEGE